MQEVMELQEKLAREAEKEEEIRKENQALKQKVSFDIS